MSFAYVDPANDNLVCCICRAPFIDPYTTRTCCHTFCSECIIRAISVSQQCPIDRSPLTTDDLTLADPLVRNLVDELIVECPNRPSGCQHTCQRQLLDVHLREFCQHVLIPCSNSKCEKSILKRDMPHHSHNDHDSTICETCGEVIASNSAESHLDSCQKTNITCSACLSEFPRNELSSHESACPDLIVPCTHSDMGCPWTGRRSTLKDTHVPLCPYEAIKGFFSIHQQREEAMRQENLRLQQKVDTLQGVVNVMKRELSIGQEALGPWYRSAQTRINLPRTGGGGSFSSGFALEGSRSPSSQFSSNVASDIVSPPPAAHFNDPTEALASYFPDQIDGFMPREYPLVDSRGSGPSTMFTPHMLTPQHPTPPLRPPPISTPYIYPAPTLSSTPSSSSTPTSNTTITTTVHNALSLGSTVAPLNLSGTLEGSLSGLRESIVTVSAAVDSLGRQHEVAVTTEAMRMNEEVRSLRAVVQGLRMQVHSMMVDRNAQVTGRHLELPTSRTQVPPPPPPPPPPPSAPVNRSISVSPSSRNGTAATSASNETTREGIHPPWLPSYPIRFPLVPSSIPITKL